VNKELPRLPQALYQSGFQIGLVDGFSLSQDGKQITFANPKIASGTVDFAKNMEFQDLIVNCPGLTPPNRRQSAFTASSVIGSVTCSIIGKR
jgi:hypothetical protein